MNGASITSTFTFNTRLQPNRIQVTTAGAPPTPCQNPAQAGNIMDLTYGFNLGSSNNSNVASIANNRDSTRSQTFTYDELNRIKTAETPTAWGLSFGYDIWANLLSATVTKGSAPMLSLGVNNNNRITNPSFSYDPSGNMTADASYTYTYDAENRMTSGAGVSYTYDGDSRRVKKSNGKLDWYGASAEVLLETDLAGNNPDEYIFFGGQRLARRKPTGEVNYYFADHLGSSRLVTSATGQILDDADFYPFGGERIVLSTSGNNYKFTGKERDSETGNDYFGARYFPSSLGRFLTPDPPLLDQQPGSPQSWNLYTYVRNNPLRYIDPTGHEAGCGNWSPCGAFIGGPMPARTDWGIFGSSEAPNVSSWSNPSPYSGDLTPKNRSSSNVRVGPWLRRSGCPGRSIPSSRSSTNSGKPRWPCRRAAV